MPPTPLAGGMVQHGYQCEMIWGSAHEFECAAIVGRKFESVADHARHVAGGGCAKIIDVLAVDGAASSGPAVESSAGGDARPSSPPAGRE